VLCATAAPWISGFYSHEHMSIGASEIGLTGGVEAVCSLQDKLIDCRSAMRE